MGHCGSCGEILVAGSTYCVACVDKAKELLAETIEYYAELSTHLGHLRGYSLGTRAGGVEGRPLPGGDILALLGPGSPGYGEDEETSRPNDPTSVSWELAYWKKSWQETRKETSRESDVPSSIGYLYTHCSWASTCYPGFPEFIADLTKIHLSLAIATSRYRFPVRANAACFRCTGVLERRIDSRGLEQEHVTCRECGDTYDTARYLLALRAAAEKASSYTDAGGGLWQTIAVLSHRLGRSPHSLAAWRRDGLVRSQTWSGLVFLNAQDVEREHHKREIRA